MCELEQKLQTLLCCRGSGITIEFQRRQAKEMQAYFKQLKAAQTVEKRK